MAGVICQYVDYHVLFWITFVVALTAFLGILAGVREAPTQASGHLDVRGAILLSLTLLALLVPLSEAGVWGWSSPFTLGLLVLSVVLGAAFGWAQLRTDEPLVDVTTLVRRPILLADLASVLIGFSMFGSILATLVTAVGSATLPALAAYRWIFAICGGGALVAAVMALGIRGARRAV